MQLNKSNYIEKELESLIRSGEYTDKLPSEKEIARMFDTTPVTASKALNRLQERKIITRIAGRGSYVNPDLSKNIRLMLRYIPAHIVEEIHNELTVKFPHDKFEFIPPCDFDSDFAKEADIFLYTSYFPSAYDTYFSALPETMINYMNDENYYGEAFNVHRHNKLFYGIPLILSPSVMVYNKTLFSHYFGAHSPNEISIDDLLRVSKKLSKGTYLFDAGSAGKNGLFPLCFSQKHDAIIKRINLNDFSWETINEAISLYHRLYGGSIGGDANFSKGNVVFHSTCRQFFCKGNAIPWNFPWDIAPEPFGENRINLLSSESLFVSNEAANPRYLFSICEFFLSPAIQNIFARYRYGIPMLKSAAVQSMDSHKYRDDIFYNELKKSVFHYEIFDKSLQNSFISDVLDYNAGKLTFESFKENTKKIYDLNQRNLHIQNSISITEDQRFS